MDSLALPQVVSHPDAPAIIARITPSPTPEAQELIARAYRHAEAWHAGQRRKSGEPFIVHPASVAWLLTDIVSDPATIAAGLLHDVIEDCDVKHAELVKLFSKEVADLVDGVTKISSLNFSARETQVATLRKMILAMSRDVRVVLIKLCDRLHNMMTLEHLPRDRQRAIAQSTMDVYAPLANRLGMTRMRVHLEDLSMQYLYPLQWSDLNNKLRERFRHDQHIVDRTRHQLMEKFAEQNLDFSIQGRRKHVYSLYQKMRSQGLTFDEVHDILAIRVLTRTIPECYYVLGIVHSLYKPITGRFKDYIAAPKENGYQSIHTSVIGVDNQIVEIQIRTEQMHEDAEEGIAAHWRYKEGSQGAREREHRQMNWLRQLVGWLKDVHDPSEFMRELKRDVFEASVFCYTPKGDIIEMPRGSTALDLAYRIHTQLGNTCAGARINNRLASIRTELETGDVVEIVTAKNAHPTNDWLQIAKTGRARYKIRHYLKEQQREEFLARGQRMLAEHVRARFGSQAPESRVREILLDNMDNYPVSTFDDLMVEVGCGTIKIGSLVSRIEQVVQPPARKRVPREVHRSARKRDAVLVQGMAGAITRMAGCCKPMPGDDIVGFITQGRGISIHKADCPSLERSRRRCNHSGKRIVSVEWGDASHRQVKATVRLVCRDRNGLLSDVTGAVTQLGHSIVGSHTSSTAKDNRAIITMKLLANQGDDLNRLLNRLAQIPGVTDVRRVIRDRRRAASGASRGNSKPD